VTAAPYQAMPETISILHVIAYLRG